MEETNGMGIQHHNVLLDVEGSMKKNTSVQVPQTPYLPDQAQGSVFISREIWEEIQPAMNEATGMGINRHNVLLHVEDTMKENTLVQGPQISSLPLWITILSLKIEFLP